MEAKLRVVNRHIVRMAFDANVVGLSAQHLGNALHRSFGGWPEICRPAIEEAYLPQADHQTFAIRLQHHLVPLNFRRQGAGKLFLQRSPVFGEEGNPIIFSKGEAICPRPAIPLPSSMICMFSAGKGSAVTMGARELAVWKMPIC